MKKFIVIISLLAICLSLFGCTERAIDKTAIQILNSDRIPTDKVKVLDTVMIKMSNLKSNQLYTVTIKDSANSIISKVRYSTDEHGNIAPVPIWYQAGLNNRGAEQGKINVNALLRSYTATILGPETDVTIPFTIFDTKEGEGKLPIAAAAISTGNNDYCISDSFDYDPSHPNLSNDVYLWSENLPNGLYNGTVNIYIIKDKDIKDADNTGSFEVVSHNTVSVSVTGSIFTKILNKTEFAAAIASYGNNFDVFVDVNKNGVYDDTIDILDGKSNVGFTIQQLVEETTIVRIQVASKGFYDNNGYYGYVDTFRQDGSDLVGPYWADGDWADWYKGIKAIFNPYVKKSYHWNDYGSDEDAGFMAPYSGKWVNIYVVTSNAVVYVDNHLDIAADRPALVDVSGQYGNPQVEMVPLAASCYNGASQFIVYPKAYLRLGHYSIIVDVNNNGKWDSDIDFIDDVNADDGASHTGFSITAN
ncbi:MAG: hypothetical protein DKM50_00110 [Candidatus Margulisiibacteriota bacterium]|nr:MAG: hypothetical protein A2X43_02750 [Candidatus Margulisbacteria bacterium GWD2_39_127]OGI02752.1 MAG: hypothetical protein A2X42_01785 [Candidatus Margulisbacteria bacterium GWF2_38_17]OGI09362.1 MAG: hypothetical protein A2X41_09590 [Candidatus Margulisbacteria bacterium GWE2_39_32]PZM84939.1 MAG: hypothetical protein DKM50_00110 [Candidatus Margulisiibacteriota bacterium]HAR63655.1 hypothetical protein [Candidatus Margulisiibacteriota bacterium]